MPSPRIIEHDGRALPMAEWAKLLGISRQTLFNRINKGWTIHQASTLPKHSYVLPRGPRTARPGMTKSEREKAASRRRRMRRCFERIQEQLQKLRSLSKGVLDPEARRLVEEMEAATLARMRKIKSQLGIPASPRVAEPGEKC